MRHARHEPHDRDDAAGKQPLAIGWMLANQPRRAFHIRSIWKSIGRAVPRASMRLVDAAVRAQLEGKVGVRGLNALSVSAGEFVGQIHKQASTGTICRQRLDFCICKSSASLPAQAPASPSTQFSLFPSISLPFTSIDFQSIHCLSFSHLHPRRAWFSLQDLPLEAAVPATTMTSLPS